jgi:uracil-DNA glycosylase family 4
MTNELVKLKGQVESCQKCPLWKRREQAVFGEGPENAQIMLIGLGPGYHENKEGRPFVGAAGKFLNELLALAGLKREDVYITNIIKCYLPTNKATDDEIKTCTSYLDKQIEIIQPKRLLLLGNVATKYIFTKFRLPLASMSQLHRTPFPISTLLFRTQIIPMYHPAAALRNPGLHDVIKNDWKVLAAIL